MEKRSNRLKVNGMQNAEELVPSLSSLQFVRRVRMRERERREKEVERKRREKERGKRGTEEILFWSSFFGNVSCQ